MLLGAGETREIEDNQEFLSAVALLISLPTQAFGESSIKLRPEIQLTKLRSHLSVQCT
jgi:hypothetical protein